MDILTACLVLVEPLIDSAGRFGEPLEIDRFTRTWDLGAVLGLRAFEEVEADDIPPSHATAADGASVLLGSLMDGWAVNDGDIVTLPLFGVPRGPRTGPRGVQLRISFPEAVLVFDGVTSSTIGRDSAAGTQAAASTVETRPLRLRVRAGKTRFASAPQSSTHGFPTSPLEWASACVDGSWPATTDRTCRSNDGKGLTKALFNSADASTHVAHATAALPGRDTELQQVLSLAWGYMCAPSMVSVRAACGNGQGIATLEGATATATGGSSMAAATGTSGPVGRPLPLAPKPSAPCGIVLTGPPGSGKSTLALTVARGMGGPVYRITASGLYAGQVGGTEQRLTSLIAHAVAHAPCTVIIEDATVILPKRPTSTLAQRAMLMLFQAMDECTQHGVPILWLACVQDLRGLNVAALGPSRLHQVVHLQPLTPSQRQRALLPLLQAWLSSVGALSDSPAAASPDLDSLASWAAARTHGYSPADLTALVAEAGRVMDTAVEGDHVSALGTAVTLGAAAKAEAVGVGRWAAAEGCLAAALARVKPSIGLHAIGGLPRPISLSQVLPIPTTVDMAAAGEPTIVATSAAVASAGAQDALHLVRAAVLTPLENPGLYSSLGTSPPTGMLLHGPPGTGKTMLAHAVAHEARSRGIAHALVVSGPDIISALVGSSEAALSAVFARARELSPCILVMDCFEALAPARAYQKGKGSARTSTAGLSNDRLLSVLLTEMDGIANAGTIPPPPPSGKRAAAGSAAGHGRAGGDRAGQMAAAPAAVEHLLLDPVLSRAIFTDHGSSARPLNAAVAAQRAAFGGAGGSSGPASILSPVSTSTAAGTGGSTGAGMGAADAKESPVVIVIAITRDIALLDPAVIRPGRLDVHVRTRTLNSSERRHALQTFLERSPVLVEGAPQHTQTGAPEGTVTHDAGSIMVFPAAPVPSASPWTSLLDWLSSDDLSVGWSYAECEACAQGAASIALRRYIEGKERSSRDQAALVGVREAQGMDDQGGPSPARPLPPVRHGLGPQARQETGPGSAGLGAAPGVTEEDIRMAAADIRALDRPLVD